MSAYDDRAQVAEEHNAMVGEFNAIDNALDNVRGYYPERADDIAQILAKLAGLHTLAEDVHGFVVDNKRDEARFLLEFKFSAALDDAVGHLNRLINILGASSRSAVQEAEAARRWTIEVTSIGVGGGTLAALAVALALSQYSLARPLRRLADVMMKLAKGDLATAIDGLDRKDEVGVMARSVAVFRENAVALKRLEQQRTADKEALTDISRETASVQQATQAVVAAISAMSGVIGAIDDISLAITDAVGQQDVVSRNIAQNVDDAAARTRQVSSIISAANEFAVQTGELAARILQAAQDLSQQAVVLQTDAAGFIGHVKAA